MEQQKEPEVKSDLDIAMEVAHSILEDGTLLALAGRTDGLSDPELERAWFACTALAQHFADLARTFGAELRSRHAQGSGR